MMTPEASGRLAAAQREIRLRNPYPVDTREHARWNHGYDTVFPLMRSLVADVQADGFRMEDFLKHQLEELCCNGKR